MSKSMFTNQRIFIDENTHSIYNELTNRAVDKAEDIPFIKMPDLFLLAACVGVKENKYKELGSKKRDIFVADAFDSYQLPILMALAYKQTQNLEDLTDPKLIVNICEGWANGGIKIVHEQIMTRKGTRPLYKFVDFIMDEAK
jgi:hypothetical protein